MHSRHVSPRCRACRLCFYGSLSRSNKHYSPKDSPETPAYVVHFLRVLYELIVYRLFVDICNWQMLCLANALRLVQLTLITSPDVGILSVISDGDRPSEPWDIPCMTRSGIGGLAGILEADSTVESMSV